MTKFRGEVLSTINPRTKSRQFTVISKFLKKSVDISTLTIMTGVLFMIIVRVIFLRSFAFQ